MRRGMQCHNPPFSPSAHSGWNRSSVSKAWHHWPAQPELLHTHPQLSTRAMVADLQHIKTFTLYKWSNNLHYLNLTTSLSPIKNFTESLTMQTQSIPVCQILELLLRPTTTYTEAHKKMQRKHKISRQHDAIDLCLFFFFFLLSKFHSSVCSTLVLVDPKTLRAAVSAAAIQQSGLFQVC